MGKVFKKAKRYYSTKKGIHGLTIGGCRNSGWKSDYYVVEDLTPEHRYPDRKVVFQGTLTECRSYLKKRFNQKSN